MIGSQRNDRSLSVLACVIFLLALVGIALGQMPAPSHPSLPVADSSTHSTPKIKTTTSGTPSTQSELNSKLGTGDLVEVSVYGVPELSTKARISSSGDLYLPLIDYVHVADLTLDEAQQTIEKRLSDGGFVNNPHVSVLVTESSSQAVTILGEVNCPGTYPVIGDRRLYDVISAAGGLTDKAGKAVTITHRDKPKESSTIHLPDNLSDNVESNLPVSAGDTIVVSRAGLVYVVGDVSRPSGFLIEDNKLTVLKALALAGGTTRTSSLNDSKLLRQTPQGVQQIPVPLKKILRAKAPDEPMMKGDILFVPTSGAKTVAYRGSEAIMALTTALTIVALQ